MDLGEFIAGYVLGWLAALWFYGRWATPRDLIGGRRRGRG